MTPNLKPCPFCGATEASVQPIDVARDLDAHDVTCGSCDAYVWGDTKGEAVAAWNRSPRSETDKVLDYVIFVPVALCTMASFIEPSNAGWWLSLIGFLSAAGARWEARR